MFKFNIQPSSHTPCDSTIQCRMAQSAKKKQTKKKQLFNKLKISQNKAPIFFPYHHALFHEWETITNLIIMTAHAFINVYSLPIHEHVPLILIRYVFTSLLWLFFSTILYIILYFVANEVLTIIAFTDVFGKMLTECYIYILLFFLFMSKLWWIFILKSLLNGRWGLEIILREN